MVWWITFLFISRGWPGGCASLTRGTHGTKMHYGEKGKPAEAVWCFGQYSAAKPCESPAIHVDVTLTHITYLSIVTDHIHIFMETIFPNGSGIFHQVNISYHKAIFFWNGLRNTTTNSKCWHSPDFNSIEHLWDVLDKQVQPMEASPRNFQDLKDLLLTSLWQIPQHTFKGQVESMPRRVRAVLVAKGEPTQY